HELYWAHLMSETRAVAVLLWLFELARMGPRLKPSISPLYWGTLVFLSALVLSVSLLAIQLSLIFIQRIAQWSQLSIVGDFHSLIFVFLVVMAIASGFVLIVSIWKGAWKLAAWSLGITLTATLIFILADRYEMQAEDLTKVLLPILVAAL